jgi:hypothetical protein
MSNLFIVTEVILNLHRSYGLICTGDGDGDDDDDDDDVFTLNCYKEHDMRYVCNEERRYKYVKAEIITVLTQRKMYYMTPLPFPICRSPLMGDTFLRNVGTTDHNYTAVKTSESIR